MITDWFVGSNENYEKLKASFLEKRVIKYGVVVKGWTGDI